MKEGMPVRHTERRAFSPGVLGRVAGATAAAVSGAAVLHGTAVTSEIPVPPAIVRSVDDPSLGLKQPANPTSLEVPRIPSREQGPVVSAETLEQRLDGLFDEYKKEIMREASGSKNAQILAPKSPSEATEWFDGLNHRQKASVFIYGLMAALTLRAAGRYTKAFVDPRGDIRLKRSPSKEEQEAEQVYHQYLKGNMRRYIENNFEKNGKV